MKGGHINITVSFAYVCCLIWASSVDGNRTLNFILSQESQGSLRILKTAWSVSCQWWFNFSGHESVPFMPQQLVHHLAILGLQNYISCGSGEHYWSSKVKFGTFSKFHKSYTESFRICRLGICGFEHLHRLRPQLRWLLICSWKPLLKPAPQDYPDLRTPHICLKVADMNQK